MRVAGIAVLLLIMVGCDSSDRVAKLEKKNKELQTAQSERDRVANYDLQSKCAKDAKQWFGENWPSDKTTVLLTYTDHYSKSFNKCFTFVEYHYSAGRNMDWINHMTIYDIYENSEEAGFTENHMFWKNAEGIDTDHPSLSIVRLGQRSVNRLMNSTI